LLNAPEKTEAEKDKEFNGQVEKLAKGATFSNHKAKVESLKLKIEQENEDMVDREKNVKRLAVAEE